ncbi:hypothetical protein NDU88_006992 [Pleurodeles waltl]|uniref:Uncharacterized protein n=1 Tax=Pleurodeles waltl TaxID=8319 RepID=A0AAV7VT07_PLEWA|nr:hypothetical protein NDU88_006992 [Pleurodeles waltl]
MRTCSRAICKDPPDEDSMTPTLWDVYHINIEVLRLIVTQGGKGFSNHSVALCSRGVGGFLPWAWHHWIMAAGAKEEGPTPGSCSHDSDLRGPGEWGTPSLGLKDAV